MNRIKEKVCRRRRDSEGIQPEGNQDVENHAEQAEGAGQRYPAKRAARIAGGVWEGIARSQKAQRDAGQSNDRQRTLEEQAVQCHGVVVKCQALEVVYQTQKVFHARRLSWRDLAYGTGEVAHCSRRLSQSPLCLPVHNCATQRIARGEISRGRSETRAAGCQGRPCSAESRHGAAPSAGLAQLSRATAPTLR